MGFKSYGSSLRSRYKAIVKRCAVKAVIAVGCLSETVQGLIGTDSPKSTTVAPEAAPCRVKGCDSLSESSSLSDYGWLCDGGLRLMVLRPCFMLICLFSRMVWSV